MRVLAIYSTDQILGGGEISFTLSLRLACQGGCGVLALVPAPGPLTAYLSENGIPSRCVPQDTLRRPANWRALLQPRADWLQAAREFSPDLIHCNAVRTALYGQALGRALDIPALFHARKSERDTLIDPFLMLRMDAIVCISEVVKKRFPAWLGRNKLRVLSNPVDFEAMGRPPQAAGALRAEWGGASRRLVGVVGRLSPVKGQHLMIDAAPLVLARVPQARFVFIGAEDPSWPGYSAALRERIQKAGLEDAFVFAGFHADMPAAYHALDLVAFPTRSEGLGRIVIEAGAARKAIVTSDIEVLREVLSPGLLDLTVPLESAGAWARRIADLLEDRQLNSSVGVRLLGHVRSRFSPENHRRELLGLYDELVARH